MATGGCSRGPVKVVIINTQYVQTDATSFKSVVQKLTGKDSDTYGAKVDRNRHDKGGTKRSFLMRDVSFKEFDRLLREMPPINDLLR
ncbi:VQ motif-containing protein 1 [Vigna radiata var. radiata]|uniref:VQ motif-containing protein 1 n=1 Tax=Vigna radiata var. radiata TaxID=3916 RepID=A0A3Q0EY25_VIGRR|nr:VQ motif-containing protein 1 [Vigna radiata var. radiata]